MNKEKLLGRYRTFKHNILYVDGYDKKVMVILLLLLILDLLCLWSVL